MEEDNQNYIPMIYDHHMMSDEELIEYCQAKRREATASCMEKLKEHIVIYLKDNLNNNWQHRQHRINLRQFDEDYEIILYHDRDESSNSIVCSYEDWIRQCHPENARELNNDRRSLNEIKIDKRFYFEKSDHRIMWNECVAYYGHPELIVEARQ